ncbi:protein disulfide isomerase-like 1-3 [Chenopodium quinoa]|uniref:Protein disulfide-isomerase n=1 Tax=Chenopodium quinoa TaxID=63459 RepID=A0A803N623_CHEQI|nr:protein disulfide isomerase-like 1-3 [Chenopodium quinoa]
MAALTTLLFVLLPLVFLIATLTTSADETAKPIVEDDENEDLSFLEVPKAPRNHPYYADPKYKPQGDDEIDLDDFQALSPPVFDDKDVVVLNKTNFDELINMTMYVMVEFYAPWCGYCKQLAPEYAAAATELKKGGSDAVLAKVDAIQETELADKYNVDGFPTLYLFVDGVYKSYEGERTREGIVSWLKKKIGYAVNNVTTVEEAEDILLAESKLVVAYVDSLTGLNSEVLNAAAEEEDGVNFYQTTSADVAEVFQIDSKVKRPALVLLKKEVEKLSHFDGDFAKSAILDFVSKSKQPLIINFNMESASFVFESPIQNQLFLFAPAQHLENLTRTLEEAAKLFKGKIIFSYVQMDNKEYGQAMMDFFGVEGDAPRVLAYTGNDDRRKFFLDGDITSDSVKLFSENFLADKLEPFYKSDPIPENNHGDVKIVVGKNFDEIVMDESKDVLLEIYAPWCSHCKALEPTYTNLAGHLKGIESLVVAKMDGTKNEHAKAKARGFPTILFYPAGKKSFDPIIFDSNPTGAELYKFTRKHATTPFKIQKPISTSFEDAEPNIAETVPTTDAAVGNQDAKDEL